MQNVNTVISEKPAWHFQNMFPPPSFVPALFSGAVGDFFGRGGTSAENAGVFIP